MPENLFFIVGNKYSTNCINLSIVIYLDQGMYTFGRIVNIDDAFIYLRIYLEHHYALHNESPLAYAKIEAFNENTHRTINSVSIILFFYKHLAVTVFTYGIYAHQFCLLSLAECIQNIYVDRKHKERHLVGRSIKDRYYSIN